MRFSRTALLLAAGTSVLAAAPATAREWGVGSKWAKGGCFAVVEGQVLVDYDCDILLYKGGDFEVSQLNGNVFIGVEVTGEGVGRAHYRETEASFNEYEDLGPVRREKFDPACWAGEKARVCAR